jgi:amino acid adenylation domain-containing protein
MSMLSALFLLLSRYSSSRQILVASPVALRYRPGTDPVMGLFFNTLLLKIDLSDNPTIDQLLSRVRETTLLAYAHRELPYEKLLKALQPQPGLSSGHMPEVMFVMQNGPADESRPGDVTTTQMWQEMRAAKFELVVGVEDVGEEIKLSIGYDEQLYEPYRVERMLKHYERLLEAMTSYPHHHISALQMLTETEMQQLLVNWNATMTRHQPSRRIHHLFERQVEETPNSIAVVYENEKVTYRELNCRANQMARHLRASGVGPDTLVGICMEPSLEMVIGVLGTLKAGGAYVPLDPAYSKERLEFMLKDTQLPVVLTKRQMMEKTFGHKAKVICLDEDWRIIARQNTKNFVSAVQADNLTYVIYTPGSTGKLKGIGLPNRAVTNLIEWHCDTLLLGARTAQFASLSFDTSFHEFFSTWCSGGTLYLIKDDLRADTTGFAGFVSNNRIEKLILPVDVLQQLAEDYCGGRCPLTGLKEVSSAGEQLQITTPVIKLFEDLEGCSLRNHYGPSETHVVTDFALQGRPGSWQPHPSIGRPIANTQIYLLDEDMNPVPVGVPGELYIGGLSLARGYINCPALTAEKFLPNPFGDDPGSRLYATGDQAYYSPDGNINLLRRTDGPANARGRAAELGEIGEALPPSSNEKLDRTSLDLSYRAGLAQALTFMPPRTPAEEIVARVWKSFLGVRRVGIYDNFFDLGGHSLLASRIICRLREVFRIDLPLRSLFESPTVDGLITLMAEIWGGREIVEEIAWTFTLVQQLSDDEVSVMIARRGEPGN